MLSMDQFKPPHSGALLLLLSDIIAEFCSNLKSTTWGISASILVLVLVSLLCHKWLCPVTSS
jgi:hypothetical protein